MLHFFYSVYLKFLAQFTCLCSNEKRAIKLHIFPPKHDDITFIHLYILLTDTDKHRTTCLGYVWFNSVLSKGERQSSPKQSRGGSAGLLQKELPMEQLCFQGPSADNASNPIPLGKRLKEEGNHHHIFLFAPLSKHIHTKKVVGRVEITQWL